MRRFLFPAIENRFYRLRHNAQWNWSVRVCAHSVFIYFLISSRATNFLKAALNIRLNLSNIYIHSMLLKKHVFYASLRLFEYISQSWDKYYTKKRLLNDIPTSIFCRTCSAFHKFIEYFRKKKLTHTIVSLSTVFFFQNYFRFSFVYFFFPIPRTLHNISLCQVDSGHSHNQQNFAQMSYVEI